MYSTNTTQFSVWDILSSEEFVPKMHCDTGLFYFYYGFCVIYFKKSKVLGICFSLIPWNALKWSCWTFVDTKSSKCNPSQDVKRTNITPLIPAVLQGTATEHSWSKEPISLPSSQQYYRVQHLQNTRSKEPISLPSSLWCYRVQRRNIVDRKRTNITPFISTVLQGTAPKHSWFKEPITLTSFLQCYRVQHRNIVDLILPK